MPLMAGRGTDGSSRQGVDWGKQENSVCQLDGPLLANHSVSVAT